MNALEGFFVLTKMQNDLKQPETILKDLQQARNNLNPWTNLQWTETTYKEQEMTWNDIKQARNNLKRSATNRL